MTTARTAPRKVTSPVTVTLEGVWGTIRRRHPELPPVAIVVSSGTASLAKGVALNQGHFAPGRWEEDQDTHHEIFVAGEIVNDPERVLGTLLHEAAHALAHLRGIKDTSRGGRYHNAEFRTLAAEVGLDAAQVGTIGWSDTSLTEDTRAAYRVSLERLGTITVARRAESRREATGRKSNNNGVAAACPTCGRKIRMSRSVEEAGPIVCWPCLLEAEPRRGNRHPESLAPFVFAADDQDEEAGE
jgi:hypothetical protein